jgi:hypothetical protein
VQRVTDQEGSNTDLNNDSIYFKAMVDSFEEALRIQEKFNGMANVNQIAITLFIQRTKNK